MDGVRYIVRNTTEVIRAECMKFHRTESYKQKEGLHSIYAEKRRAYKEISWVLDVRPYSDGISAC